MTGTLRSSSSSSIAQPLVDVLPRLRRYAVALCRSPTQADDLVQGACERALANAASWTPGTRFDAWIFRILRNHWIDGLRRAKSENLVDDIDGIDVAERIDSEQAILSRLTLDAVRRALDHLPDEQREVLLLVCVEEMAYRETAQLLEVPIGTVMSRLARARKKLIDLVAEQP